jgi:hypothetical protein
VQHCPHGAGPRWPIRGGELRRQRSPGRNEGGGELAGPRGGRGQGWRRGEGARAPGRAEGSGGQIRPELGEELGEEGLGSGDLLVVEGGLGHAYIKQRGGDNATAAGASRLTAKRLLPSRDEVGRCFYELRDEGRRVWREHACAGELSDAPGQIKASPRELPKTPSHRARLWHGLTACPHPCHAPSAVKLCLLHAHRVK